MSGDARWLGILAAGLAVGMPATAFALLRDQQILFNDGWWASADARDAARVIRAAASLSLGLAYMAAFALLFLHGLPRKLLMVFVPAGRMALSNYLAQSLIGVALYYTARGPASVPARELSPVLLLGLALFATQSAGSAWWLRRFHYGPCEWLWRSASCAAGKRCVAGRPPSTRRSGAWRTHHDEIHRHRLPRGLDGPGRRLRRWHRHRHRQPSSSRAGRQRHAIFGAAGRGYEVVGLVRAESDAGLTAQSSMEYAIEELKKQAASLGANGVLLTGSGVRAVGMNTTYNRQSHTASSSVEEVQHLEGQAIVVR